MIYKLGKTKAEKNSISLRFRDYVPLAQLPVPPKTYGNLKLADSNTFGNTQYGDCVCAGAGHETLFWNCEANRPVNITTQTVLEMYSAVTGFNPNDPSTDQGTSMPQAAKWRKKVGLADAQGGRHKVEAYVSLTPGNIEEVKQSIYLFGACGVGWELPQSALEQAQQNKPWSVVSGSPIAGGHYTAAIGYSPKYLYIISWGQLIKVTWSFFVRYMDEGVAYLSKEFMTNDRSPLGFDVVQLESDLKAL